MPEHIMCEKCRAIRPRASFKKLATHAQSRAWGNSGGHKLEILSKNCAECRPKLKPPRKLSPTEFEKRMMSGDLRMGAVTAEAMLRKKKEDGKARIRRGVKNRTINKIRNEWEDVWQHISKDYERRKRQYEYIRSARSSRTSQQTPTRYIPSQQRLDYAQHVYQAAYAAKEIIKYSRKWAQPPQPDTSNAYTPHTSNTPQPHKTLWTDILDDEQRLDIQALYDAIPHDERVRMRESSVLPLKKVSTIVEKSSTTNQGE